MKTGLGATVVTTSGDQERQRAIAGSISLPKGGGAIWGIGEKFAANPVTASISVPSAASPGRSDLSPRLAFSHDSSAGNSPFGFGWSLSLPSITCKTDKGFPRYQDGEDSDVLLLSCAEDLVPMYRLDPDGTWTGLHQRFKLDRVDFWVRDAAGRVVIRENELDGYCIRRYGPPIEGLFARIERWTYVVNSADVHWPVAGDANLAMPYLDWGITDDSDPLTSDFMGGDGDKAQNQRVTTGPFAFSTDQFLVQIGEDHTGDSGLCRDFRDDANSYQPTPTRVGSDLTATLYSSSQKNWKVFSEGNLHSPVHRWMGGNMADAASPNHPIYFLHHCYIDLLWECWKQQHSATDAYLPTAGQPGYLASQLVFDAPGKLSPWPGIWMVAVTISTTNLDDSYG
ncbi:SpvB/TcaC N-terminal domain-containing protein [Cupriavidus sp. 8B]